MFQKLPSFAGSLHSFRHFDKIFLVLVPFILSALNDSWMFNRIGDVDTWFYYGHFRHFLDYNKVSSLYGRDYYETRLPFIIPGYIFYSVFGEYAARYVFNITILYGCVILCLYYVVKFHTNKNTAYMTSVLLATDIYFLRSIAWDYVDSGVMTYQALTFMLLTAGVNKKKSQYFDIFAGFSAASMVFVHLGSIVLLPVFLSYLIYMRFNRGNFFEKNTLKCIFYILSGATFAQIIYGLANKYLIGGRFLFILLQMKIATTHDAWINISADASELMESAYWLTIHCAVCIASLIFLILRIFRKNGGDKFGLFCSINIITLYGTIVVFDLTKNSVYLGRQGLYASFFLFFSYFCLSNFIFRCSPFKLRWLLFFSFIFISSIIARLLIGSGLGLASWHVIPMYILALSLAAALGVIILFPTPATFVVAMAAYATSTMFIYWPFVRDDSIIVTHDTLQTMARGRIPVVFFKADDPLARFVFSSIVASFTERAYWLHGDAYPKFSQPAQSGEVLHSGDFVAIMSSTIEQADTVGQTLGNHVDSYTHVGSFHVARADGSFWVHCFDISNAIILPASISESRLTDHALPAAALPSLTGKTEGSSRVATEGAAAPGYLMFGPYAELEAGRYTVTFRYNATGPNQLWDIAATTAGPDSAKILAQGQLPDTRGAQGEMTVPIESAVPLKSFETRVLYSGQGALSVQSVKIERQP